MLLVFACNNAQQNVNTSSKQNDNVLIPVIKNEKVGYIDLNGQWVIQPQFQDAQLFNNQGLARVKQNDRWGVIDQTGKIIIAPNYPNERDIYLHKDGMIRIELDTCPYLISSMGLFDKTGKEIIGLNKFSYIGSFCDCCRENDNPLYFYQNDVTYFCDIKSKLCGLIDKSGKIVAEPKFSAIYGFGKNGLAVAKINDDKIVIIDQTGKIVAEPEIECLPNAASDFATVKQNDKCGYLDTKTGKIVIEPKYDEVEFDPFVASDLAKVKINGKYGYIDKTGKMVIEPQFEEASTFDNRIELTSVMKNYKYGFIDKTGKMVIQPVYEEAFNFGTDNLARVKTTTGEWKTIDTKGQTVKPKHDELASQYDEVELVPGTDNVFLTRKEVGEGENLHDEFGILKDGKHTVLKDVDEIGNLMYPYY